MNHFLFLVVRDPEINSLLWQIRDVVSRRTSRTPIHITVRGPYEKPITLKSIAYWSKRLAGRPLVIGPVARFSVGNRTVVYFKAQHEKLKLIWRKPDYPITKYGFNPHITIYDGDDSRIATATYEFLAKEKIELVCDEYELTPYVSAQLQLIGESMPLTLNLMGLIGRGKVHATLLHRLQHQLAQISTDYRAAFEQPRLQR